MRCRTKDRIKLIILYFMLPLILTVLWIDFIMTDGKDVENNNVR